MTERTRRHVLAATGVAATGVLAGCSNSSAEEPDESEPSGTILGDVTVENSHDDSHTVDVLVKFDGEIEHWSTHRLEADDGRVGLERGWPGDPGDFRVIARLDEAELMEVGPADWNNLPCLDLVIRVSQGGELEIMTGAGGGKCEGESAGSDGNGDDGSD